MVEAVLITLAALSHASAGVYEGVPVAVQEAPIEVRAPPTTDRRLIFPFAVAAIRRTAATFEAAVAPGTVHISGANTGPGGELHPVTLGPASVVIDVPVGPTDLHPSVTTIVCAYTGRDRVDATPAQTTLAVTTFIICGAYRGLGLDAFTKEATLVI